LWQHSPVDSTTVAIRRGSSTDSHFSICLPIEAANLLSAASSSVYGILLQASQASDVGSIPIARSINHDDSTVLTSLTYQNPPGKWPCGSPKLQRSVKSIT